MNQLIEVVSENEEEESLLIRISDFAKSVMDEIKTSKPESYTEQVALLNLLASFTTNAAAALQLPAAAVVCFPTVALVEAEVIIDAPETLPTEGMYTTLVRHNCADATPDDTRNKFLRAMSYALRPKDQTED